MSELAAASTLDTSHFFTILAIILGGAVISGLCARVVLRPLIRESGQPPPIPGGVAAVVGAVVLLIFGGIWLTSVLDGNAIGVALLDELKNGIFMTVYVIFAVGASVVGLRD